METLFIPSENDFKKWIREAVNDCLRDYVEKSRRGEEPEDGLLSRKEIAKFLKVSLVTLTDWMKRGLPSHKQRGRVYFMKSEVLDYIKESKINQLKFGNRFQDIKREIA